LNKNNIFKFSLKKKTKPKRIVILGSSGIISKNLQKKLNELSIKFITIGRSKIDFKKKKSIKILERIIKNNDTIIFCAAEAPAKNVQMLINNIEICNNVCEVLKKRNINQLINISSDAVYSDSKGKIDEKSVKTPDNFHGIMHLTRELILSSKFKNILCNVRPTLIYGIEDTHNGYGPNKFINLALKNQTIYLFGNGEERRDHIFIDDLIDIIIKCIHFRSIGSINAVTGKVYSFKYLAKLIIKICKSNSKIDSIKRIGPMPHNGYRPFNTKLLNKYFKGINMQNLENNLINYAKKLK
tara:strand:+ start:236 stop:1129 length:894 start_codon:yes stop_codon:yes gene_type:complete